MLELCLSRNKKQPPSLRSMIQSNHSFCIARGASVARGELFKNNLLFLWILLLLLNVHLTHFMPMFHFYTPFF